MIFPEPSFKDYKWINVIIESGSEFATKTYEIYNVWPEPEKVTSFDEFYKNFQLNHLSPKDDKLRPIINNISGPSTLKTDEIGTWFIDAIDPNNRSLFYSTYWDDGGGTNNKQSKFTRSFSKEGSYCVVVSIDNGLLEYRSGAIVNITK